MFINAFLFVIAATFEIEWRGQEKRQGFAANTAKKLPTLVNSREMTLFCEPMFSE